MAPVAPSDRTTRLVSTALDTRFYRTVYEDVARTGVDPVRHYLDEGWREGRDPAPWFSSREYLELNPDVSDVDPFGHYLAHGWREGREIRPSRFGAPYVWEAEEGTAKGWSFEPLQGPTDPMAARGMAHGAQDDARAQIAQAFDVEFYLEANPDVAAAGQDPIEHYLTFGWRERRDPSRTFSVDDYLDLNPDIAAAGVEPFTHYVVAGRAEGRPLREEMGFRRQVIARLKTVGHRLDLARKAGAKRPVRDLAALREGVTASRNSDGALHVTASHDDFTSNVGGVQLCLQREAAAIAARATDHLHLYPAAAWPIVRPDDDPAPVGVVWNGQDLGLFAPATVAAVLAERNKRRPGGSGSFALHNLLGHGVEDTVKILAAAGMSKGFFWLHDFTSLCAGVHLMRDDVVDCGAPPADSGACTICVYGDYRSHHVQSHARLFSALDLTVAAPSQAAFDTWRAATTAPADQPHVVLPHARLVERGPARPGGEALRVAFLGMPSPHKGWPVFKDLAQRFADDPRYDFLHLGATPDRGAAVAFHSVAVSADTPLEMRDRMDELQVDIAVIWSLCRETFSFASYEAAAAGCAILTGPDSGNVAAFVRESGVGRVLPDEAALMNLFESGEALALSRTVRKPVFCDLEFSALTVDLLEPR